VSGFRRLSERHIFDGWIIKVRVGEFEAPDGTRFERDVVHHPGAVAIAPIDAEGNIVLVRQYRSAIDAHLVEIPAGLRDVEGEPLEDTARRELLEEVGLVAGTVTHLTSVHNSVGFCDEMIHIFLGTDLTEAERELTDSPEELEMSIIRIPLTEAMRQIETGEITDAKTVIAVMGALRAAKG
jgi:ADP-ribose pyrophosphatase